MKLFADDTVSEAQLVQIFFDRVEYIVGKGENAGYKQCVVRLVYFSLYILWCHDQTKMKIDRLLSICNAHIKVIYQQLLKVVTTKQDETFCEFDIILLGINAKFESIKLLNEKILEQIDVAKLDEEMVEAAQYVLDIDIKLGKL